MNEDLAPIEDLFGEDYEKIRPLIEQEDGFLVDSVDIRKLVTDPELLVIQGILAKAAANLMKSAEQSFVQTVLDEEFTYSRKDVGYLLAGLLWITDILLKPAEQLPFVPGKKYRVGRPITSHQPGEEVEVLFVPRYGLNNQAAFSRFCHVGCFAKNINLIGPEISAVVADFPNYFQLIGEFDLEKRRSERRKR